MDSYWNERYKNGGNSGAGSYGEYAKYKSDYINNIISKYDIKTISDFGCGDGNQISLLNGFDNYYGFDVSSYIIDLCFKKFKDSTNMNFYNKMSDLPKSDLTLSLDVIYHILDEKEYENYLSNLFDKSSKYVLIFSSNHSNNDVNSKHIYHRKFSDYVELNKREFVLVNEESNFLLTSAKFFLYKRMCD